jgi:hypothetical protein
VNIKHKYAWPLWTDTLIKSGGVKLVFEKPTISLEMPVPSQGNYGFHSFRLLTDFVCLYTYEFWLSLCKIVRSSVILLLPLLFSVNNLLKYVIDIYISCMYVFHAYVLLYI